VTQGANLTIWFNATIHQISGGQHVDAEYVNRTILYGAPIFCSSRKSPNTMEVWKISLISIGSLVGAVLVFGQIALCVRFCVSKKKIGRQWAKLKEVEMRQMAGDEQV